MHIAADISSSFHKIEIRKEKDFDYDLDLTGSLGIQDQSQDNKPRIKFIFPKFTKLSQVTILSYFFLLYDEAYGRKTIIIVNIFLNLGIFLLYNWINFGRIWWSCWYSTWIKVKFMIIDLLSVNILKIIYFSLLDLEFLTSKLKGKEVLNAILYMLSVGSVVWLLYEKIQIFVERPTTAIVEIIDSKDIPISFTLCKVIYGSRFDGNFSRHTITNMKNVSIVYDNKEFDFLDQKDLTFEFVSYLDDPMMCKEFDLANIDKDRIKFVRDALNEDNNLHLYIHQPGMFYIQEFKLKYPNRFFRTNKVDDTNENAKVLVESYDISDDPHFPCSSEIHQECVKREIIRIFNSTYGCTYPLQT